MHVEYYPGLLDIVKSLQYALKNSDPHKLLFRRQDEPLPLEVDLSFSPAISEKTVEEFTKQDVCTFCDRRLSYKSNQFSKPVVKLPYMILIHNSLIMSEKQYYESPSVDALFRKMIKGGLGCAPEDFLIREILRCRFGEEDEKNPVYAQNCLQHLRKDIDRYQVKGILILGQAASILFKNDTVKIKEMTGQVFELEGVSAMICPGPNRLDYMYQKNMEEEKINAERRTIFTWLTKFKTEVMRA